MESLDTKLTYDPDTGEFKWVNGVVAGTTDKDGYRVIKYNSKSYKAHHLAWYLTYGVLPDYLDHLNRVRDDNRISNLAECSHKENMQNKSLYKGSTTGVPGVTEYHKYGCYRARYRQKHIGYFSSIEGAASAIEEYKESL